MTARLGVPVRRAWTDLRIFLLVTLVVMIIIPAGRAEACSVVDSYRIPTNFELVERADLIVIARVVDGPADVGDEPELVLGPVRVLKGNPPLDAIQKLSLRCSALIGH